MSKAPNKRLTQFGREKVLYLISAGYDAAEIVAICKNEGIPVTSKQVGNMRKVHKAKINDIQVQSEQRAVLSGSYEKAERIEKLAVLAGRIEEDHLFSTDKSGRLVNVGNYLDTLERISKNRGEEVAIRTEHIIAFTNLDSDELLEKWDNADSIIIEGASSGLQGNYDDSEFSTGSGEDNSREEIFLLPEVIETNQNEDESPS